MVSSIHQIGLPYASTKMDVVSASIASSFMLKVDATLPVAGAIIEEETGLMKVNIDTIIVAAHLRL